MLPPLRALTSWYLQPVVAAGITPIGQRTATTATGSSTSITINRPGGTVNGDVVVVAVFANNFAFNTAAITGPAGFTQQVSGGATTNGTLSVFYKVASSEPSSYTFSITGGYNDSAAVAQAFTQVSNSSPLDGTGSINIDGSAGTTHTTPSQTPASVNNAVLVFFGNTSLQTISSLNNSYTTVGTIAAGSNAAVGMGFKDPNSTAATTCTETTASSCTSRNAILGLAHA